jgi:CHRD domain
MKKVTRFLTAALFLALAVSCNDDDDPPAPNPNVTFLATMNGTNEVPANASTANGTATGTFNTTTKVLTVTVNHTVAAPTAGHIHLGAAGSNGGVVFPFTTLTSPFTYTSPALTTAQEADLNANLYYVNIHTAAFPGGEIRGQLIKQ